jgi:hypothetical protein
LKTVLCFHLGQLTSAPYLSSRCSGAVAVLNYGSHGIFALDSVQTLHPLGDPQRNRIWPEMEKSEKTTLVALRDEASRAQRETK